jgi:predicted ArsR family transcriptional regulator
LLANAFEHADGPAWVSVRWDGLHPVISVASLGPGFPPHLLGRHGPGATRPDPVGGGGRGLFLAAHLARDLDIAARTAGGSVVRATLDVARDQQETAAPPHPSPTPLPLLDEARPDGAFDRETILRAMVVQLLQVVDLQHGPQAAQAAINQVGADVGRQLEAEFRIARALVDRLTPQELADCLVRVERAIGEEFQIAEASQTRLVLTSSRCPFGDTVRREPSLCQMMAGVIGGIATRNVPCGEAAVLMEERIAIGDPACRIVVWIDPDEAATPAGAQRFLAPSEHAPSPSGR